MIFSRRTSFFLAFLIALGIFARIDAPSVHAQDSATNRADLAAISPELTTELAEAAGPISFLVILNDQLEADALPGGTTSQRLRSVDRATKADAIYRTLSAHTAHTQAPLRAWLDAQNVDYRPFYIVNMIEVRGDARLAHTLRQHPDVNRLAANPAVNAQLENAHQPGWLQVWTGSQPQATAALPWGLTYTNADDLWALGYTGEGIVIADQDTGVQWDHNALKANYRGWFTDTQTVDHVYNWFDAWGVDGRPARCSTDAQIPCDDHGHGTHTVGTLMGDATSDGYTRLGMAPDATWIGCRNMRNGFGTPASYTACFQFFLAPYPQNGDPFVDGHPDLAPHIISNSWACPLFEGCDENSLRTVVEVTRAAGQLVVASAANDGPGCSSIEHPIAIHDATFTIGAHSSNGAIASFSSRGPVTVDGSGRLKPDISAPGVSVFSAWAPDSYINASGTSMAAPHVAGAAALLWSAVPALIGEIDLTEQALLKSASPVPVSNCSDGAAAISPNNVYGYGQMDILAAAGMAQSPGSVEITLLDLLGQPMGQREITLTDALTGYVFSAQTAANGVALVPTVFAGDYLLQVAATGIRFPNTPLTVAQSEHVQITLQATADYAVRKTLLSGATARLGSDVQFSIRITNTGAVTLTTAPLTDTFNSRYLAYRTSDFAPDNITDGGAEMKRLRWDDLTTTFNRDLGAGEHFELVVTFRALRDTSALTPLGATENVVTVRDVWADSGGGGVDVAIPITGSAHAPVTILAPTAVAIGAHGADLSGGDITVFWETVDEQNLLGFRLHRRVDHGPWVALTAQPIPPASLNPAQGYAYSYIDAALPAGARYAYALDILTLNDATIWFDLGEAVARIDLYLPLIQR